MAPQRNHSSTQWLQGWTEMDRKDPSVKPSYSELLVLVTLVDCGKQARDPHPHPATLTSAKINMETEPDVAQHLTGERERPASIKTKTLPVGEYLLFDLGKSCDPEHPQSQRPVMAASALSYASFERTVTQHRERTKHGAREIGTAAVAGSLALGLNSAPPPPPELPQTQRAPSVRRLSTIGCLAPIV
ncbi:unnamed protein product [Lota lota]